MKTVFSQLLFGLMLLSPCAAQKPHPVPTIADLHKPWLFARASEASTLFIEPHFKGKEPYAHVIKIKDKLQWMEYDGSGFKLWEVEATKTDKKELTLLLKGGGRVLIFPYWDIDHCLVMIRFAPGKETNPTRFAVPYHLLPKVPFQKAEG